MNPELRDRIMSIADAPMSLEDKLSWHFSVNLIPPVPTRMIPVAKQAIILAQQGLDLATPLDLPDGSLHNGLPTTTAGDIIYGHYLQAFVDGGVDAE
jgi:hypothetical protein